MTSATAPVVSAPPALTAAPAPVVTASAAPPASAAVPVAVAPSASASAAPFDAAGARALLRRAASGHDWAHAADAFFALAEHDPGAFHDPALMAATRDTAAASAVVGGDMADRVFAALGQRLGSDGLDVLYEIVRTRGGSKAAVRAEELLRQASVLAKGTPALQITVAFREAPCAEQPALLDRAAAEGDARTLVVLQTVGASCLARSSALENAERALKLRLRPK